MSSTILVGRAAELTRLLEAASQPPSIVLVEGEAGVGKTRLVTEMLARSVPAERRILIGRSREVRERFFLGPIVDALRTVGPLLVPDRLSPVTGVLRRLLPELANRLPPEPPSSGDPRGERHMLFRALVEILGNLGPTVCVLEDLHWADEGTAQFLRFLVDQLPPPLALIATYRHEDLADVSAMATLTARPPGSVTGLKLRLDPLSERHVAELIAAILQTSNVSSEFAAEMHAATAGIPFVVEEVLRLLHERGGAVPATGRRAWRQLEAIRVPSGISDLALERAARLRPDAQRLIDAAAVLGEPASNELLATVAGLSSARATRALCEALSAAVLVEARARRYGFRHSLNAQAIHDAMPPPERQRLHLRAARALEGEDPRPVPHIARHYRYAGSRREWARAAEAAADLAVSRFDDWTAATLLADALEGAEASPDARARMAIKLASAALSAHALQDRAVSLLRPIVDDHSVPTVLRGQVRAHVGLLLMDLGDASAGYREQARSVPELRRRPDLAAVVMGNLALPGVVEGHERTHRRWLQLALDQAERAASAPARFTVAAFAAMVPVWLGDASAWEGVDAMSWDAKSAYEQGQLLWLGSQLAGACIYLGKYRDARAFLDDANRQAAVAGWDRFVPLRETSALLLDWTAGEWSGLDARAAAHAEAVGEEFPPGATLARVVVGSLRVARGELHAAPSLVECSAAARAAGLVPALVEVPASAFKAPPAPAHTGGEPSGAVRFRPERPFGFSRNRCSDSSGLGVRFHPDCAAQQGLRCQGGPVRQPVS